MTIYNNKKIVIFGASRGGEKILKCLEERCINVVAFCDLYQIERLNEKGFLFSKRKCGKENG